MHGPVLRLFLMGALLLLVVLLLDRAGTQLQAATARQDLPLPPLPRPPSLPPLRRLAQVHAADAAAWNALGEAAVAAGGPQELREALAAFRHGAAVPSPSPARDMARRDAALLALACGERVRGIEELAAAARAGDVQAARVRAIVLILDADPAGPSVLAQTRELLPQDEALAALALPATAWLATVDDVHGCIDPWTALARARAWCAADRDARAAASLDEAQALARPMAHPAERLLPFTRARLHADPVFAHAGIRVTAALARWPDHLPADVVDARAVPP